MAEDAIRIRRVTFNEITQRAVREAFEHPRDIDRTWSTRNRRAAFSIAWSDTRFRRCCGTKYAAGFPRDAFRPCSAADRRARTRNQGLRKKNTGRLTPISPPPSRRHSTRVSWARAKKKSKFTTAKKRKRSARVEEADWIVRYSRSQRAPPQCDSAVHHQQIAAGLLAQAALQRKAHHDDCAAAV